MAGLKGRPCSQRLAPPTELSGKGIDKQFLLHFDSFANDAVACGLGNTQENEASTGLAPIQCRRPRLSNLSRKQLCGAGNATPIAATNWQFQSILAGCLENGLAFGTLHRPAGAHKCNCGHRRPLHDLIEPWSPVWTEQFYFWTAIHDHLQSRIFGHARGLVVPNSNLSPQHPGIDLDRLASHLPESA